MNAPEDPDAAAIPMPRERGDGGLLRDGGLLVQADEIIAELQRLQPLLPYDGAAALPGPWDLWYAQIESIGEHAGQLHLSLATCVAAAHDMEYARVTLASMQRTLDTLLPYLPHDGVAPMPGPWEFWYQLIKGIGHFASRTLEARARLLAHLGDRPLIDAELRQISDILARVARYVPWDGVAPLPGPWKFWYEAIKTMPELAAAAHASKTTLLVAITARML